MNIKDIINDIIILENKIAFLYSNLFEIELLGNKEKSIYSHCINELKDMLKEEKKLFDSFSLKIIIILKKYFESDYLNIESKSTPIPFCKHMSYRIINILETQIINRFYRKEKEISNFGMIKNEVKISNIIFSEYNDILLSFVDEFLKNCVNRYMKEQFMFNKYVMVFRDGSIEKIEDKVVNRCFSTDKSLYLGSLFEAFIEKIDEVSFLNKKNESGLSLLKNDIGKLMVKDNCYIKSYKSSLEEASTMGLELNLRSAFLLIDENMFTEQINNINNNSKTKELLQAAFGKDILDILVKDRERHKVLSLVRRK